MEDEQSNSYSEVFCFINLLGEKYINMLPRKLYEFFEENRNPFYYINIEINKPIIPQFKFSDTEPIIEYLNLEYWCTSEEKENLIKKYKKNEIMYQETLREKYNPNTLFKNNVKNINKENDNNSEGKQLTVYNENIFSRIVRKIKKFLKIL